MRDFEQSCETLNVTTHKYTKLCQFADKVLDLEVRQERVSFPYPQSLYDGPPSVTNNATRLTIEQVSQFKSAVKVITDEEIDRSCGPANDFFFNVLRDMLESLYENSRISAEKDGTISIRVV